MDALGFYVCTPPLPGGANMAVDAALMAEAARRQRPILRLYSWDQPTLSLGYFQRLEEVTTAPVAWVRRMTGGGAILHHREVTLSLALPAAHAWARGSVDDSYRAFAAPVLAVLRSLGLEAAFRGPCRTVKAAHCFAGSSCTDLLVGGRKVFGSAQRRRDGSVLTHGSLLLEVDHALWASVFGERLGDGYAGVGNEKAPWPDLLRRAFAAALGGPLVENAEITAAARLSADSGQGWPAVLS